MDSSKSGVEQERSRVLVRTLACVLQKLVDVNRKLDSPTTQVITKFHASRAPSISVADYLERINKYASCSPECLVLALIYVDRLIQQGRFALTPLNVHRVLITAVMLAAKFFDDQYFNNLYYAKVGGVPCKEINSLEVEFLFLVNFSLHVPGDVFARYHTELLSHAYHAACPCCASAAGQLTAAAMPMPMVVTPHTHMGGAVAGGVPRVPSPVYAGTQQPHVVQPCAAAYAPGGYAQPVPVPVAHATAGAMQALLAAQAQAQAQQEQHAAVAATVASSSSIAGVVLRGMGGGRSVSPVMVQPPVTPPAHQHPGQQQQHPQATQRAFTSYFSYDPAGPPPPQQPMMAVFQGYRQQHEQPQELHGGDNPQAPAHPHPTPRLFAPVPNKQLLQQPNPTPVPLPSYLTPSSSSSAAAAAFWDSGRASSVTPTQMYGAGGAGSGLEGQPTVLMHPQRAVVPSGGSGLFLSGGLGGTQQAQQQQQQAAMAAASYHVYQQPPPQIVHTPQPLSANGVRGGGSGALASVTGSRAAALCAQYPACYGVQVLMHT